MNVTGKITKIDYLDGKSKEGKEWKKVVFVLQTDEKYNNIYPLEVFGADKVDNFKKNVQLGSTMDVSFNVRAREYKGSWYVNLDAWNIKPLEGVQPDPVIDVDVDDDLPF